jgi:hypothetical protein
MCKTDFTDDKISQETADAWMSRERQATTRLKTSGFNKCFD